jgi:hypothetical protein
MSNFSFFEYSYNPEKESEAELKNRLHKLGFAHRSQHRRHNISLWSQGLCIILVRENRTLNGHSRITGIGIVCDHQALAEQHKAVPCPETDFMKIDLNPFRIYLIEENSLDIIVENNYRTVDSLPAKYSHGFEYFSGVEIDTDMPYIKDILLNLGFTRDGTENSDRLISPNKRFTVIIRHKENKGAHTIIIDTQDVFKATASLLLQDIETMKFNDEPEGFKELTHKIKGYDCVAFGKYNSYSIENYIPKEVFNANIIFRQRKQYVKLSETSLDYYEKQSTIA